IVLKWSVPVSQPSEWLTPTLGETCVIDIRDDGTWRLRVYYPRIAWAPSEAAVAFDELGAPNYEAREDTRFISDIAKASFSGSMEWPVGEQLDSVAATHLRQLAAVQQFRSDRDKERGRATADYRAAERRWHIINEPRRAAATYHATLAQSLAAALASSAF
ncbi:MAG: hypothetical protein K2F97_07400, partial [Muribaculaceae bacterium]|nr:hypothetical protein [Muribaculaceae bacterium]